MTAKRFAGLGGNGPETFRRASNGNVSASGSPRRRNVSTRKRFAVSDCAGAVGAAGPTAKRFPEVPGRASGRRNVSASLPWGNVSASLQLDPNVSTSLKRGSKRFAVPAGKRFFGNVSPSVELRKTFRRASDRADGETFLNPARRQNVSRFRFGVGGAPENGKRFGVGRIGVYDAGGGVAPLSSASALGRPGQEGPK